ncbi:GFA family protein [Paraburkholderia humisilvae]
MMQHREGGCLCGAVRYVLKGELHGAALCHCTHCQKQSGSVFSFNLFVREADYEQQGETKFYADTGDSGKQSYRHFCGNCGSPILTKDPGLPGMVLVKAGTLDSMEELQPQVEIYTDRAAKWLTRVPGTKRFERSP